MIIAAVGDVHLRATNPESRKDDYPLALRQKLKWCLRTAHEAKADLFVFPGDVYDHHTAPYSLVTALIQITQRYSEMTFGVVWGQHDERFHTTKKKNTPLGAVCASGLESLSKDPLVFEGDDQTVAVYGMSWGEEMPKPEAGSYNVLVCHKHVMDSPAGWEDESAILAKDFLRTTTFDLIISGDNHKQFELSKKRRHLINPGSLGRSSIDQVAHKPALYIIDTKAGTWERFEVPHAPAEDVFDAASHETKKEVAKRLELFAASIKTESGVTLDFRKNVYASLEANAGTIPEGAAEIIKEVME